MSGAGSNGTAGSADGPTIAEAAGGAERFTDHSVADAGIRSLFTADALWQAWLDVEVALALAEAEVGLIPSEAAEQIAHAGRLDRLDRDRVLAAMRDQVHPLMPLIDELARVAGDLAGGWVHWGATSQNIMQSGLAVQVGKAHEIVRGLLLDVISGLADLADRSADMIMAGRTHGQHAVPITFGLKVATWLDDLMRMLERIDAGVRPCLRAMMGGAVGSYAGIGEQGPRVQELVAQRLGLGSMPVPSRALLDPQAGYVSDLALLSASGARIALDVETMMQTEYSEVSEPVGDGSVGSSTMPHKRNPKLSADVIDISASLRATAGEAVAAMIHPHEADGGSSAKIDASLGHSLVAIGDLLTRLAMIVDGLQLFPERMRRNLRLSGDLIGSEAVMLALGESVGRDEAHHIVYEISMRAVAEGEDFERLLTRDERVGAHLTPQRIRALLDPRGHIGLSPELARATAARAREVVGAARAAPTPSSPAAG